MTTPAPADDRAAAAIRAAAWNQWLWSAGYPLTAGGFVVAAARREGAAAWLVALLLILPETAGLAGLLCRPLLRRGVDRKRLFFVTTLTSRAVLLPALWLMTGGGAGTAIAVAAAAVAASHAVGAVGYVGFLSWMADVVPEGRRGRLFGWRTVGKTAGLLTLPVAAGFAERALRDASGEAAADRFGVAMFLTGIALQACSILPLRAVDEPAYDFSRDGRAAGVWRAFAAAWQRRPFRRWAWHEWSHATAAGLTQSAFFLFATAEVGLHLSLGIYFALAAMMRLIQLALGVPAGRIADRVSEPVGMRAIGLAIASCGLLFWLAATPGRAWPLVGAYVCWGAFAPANVAGRKILLARTGGRDNAAAIGLATQVAGFAAGLSGLLGGFWLDAALADAWGDDAFKLLFAISLAARLASLLPLRGAPEMKNADD